MSDNESDQIPRRARLDGMTGGERAIFAAVREVEEMGVDPRLTDAVVLLQAARDSVADFVDGVNRRREVRIAKTLAEASADLARLGQAEAEHRERMYREGKWPRPR